MKRQQELYERFPKMFKQKDLPMTQTAMCWGCACGDGWFDIIYQACEKVEAYLQEQEKAGVPVMTIDQWHEKIINEGRDESKTLFYPEFTQVKEKFGTLRIYFDGGDDHIRDILSEAEDLSSTTCESCGCGQGVHRTKGWHRTLCDTCESNRFKTT